MGTARRLCCRFHVSQSALLRSHRCLSPFVSTTKTLLTITRTLGTADPFPETTRRSGTAVTGAPACGDVMKLQVKVDENGVITDAKFKTFGCGSAIASSSLATEWVIGKTVDEAAAIRNADIAKFLSL